MLDKKINVAPLDMTTVDIPSDILSVKCKADQQQRNSYSAADFEHDSQLGSSIETIISADERVKYYSGRNSLDEESDHPYHDEKQLPLMNLDDGPLSTGDPAEPEPEPKKKAHCCKSSLGVFFGLTSGFTNSLVALLVKLIETIGTFEIAVFRYVVMIVPLIFTLGCKRMNPFRWELLKSRGAMLVLRAVVGSASTYCKYFALHKLPLADASVILFSSPVFASLLALIFLKERFHWLHGMAILVTLSGCTLVSRPTFIFGSAGYNPDLEWDDHMWGSVAALASAIFTASVYVTVRQLKDVDSTIVLFWTAFVGFIISMVATATLDHFAFPTDIYEIFYILGVGVLTLVSQDALNRALKLESAGLISLLRTGDIVWSFIWQIVLFRVIPHYFSIIGALLVVFCVLTISLWDAAKKMPASSGMGRIARRIDAQELFPCCHPQSKTVAVVHTEIIQILPPAKP